MNNKEINDEYTKIVNPFKYYVQLFEKNKETPPIIKEVFRLLKPYFIGENIDYGLFKDYIISLKTMILMRYSIDAYPEYYI